MNAFGNTILILGGPRGTGEALARKLSQRGNRVVLSATSEDRLDEALRENPGLHTIACDASRAADRRLLVDLVLEYFPKLDVLVHVADIENAPDPEQPEPEHAAEQCLAERLIAPIDVTLSLLPHLLHQPAGAIVHVFAGHCGDWDERRPLDCAVDAALRAFSGALRGELIGTSVNVVDVNGDGLGAASRRETNSYDEHLASAVVAALTSTDSVARDGLSGVAGKLIRTVRRTAAMLLSS